MKDCGGWVTMEATTEATSSGWSFLLGSLPDPPSPKRVLMEPGAMTLTRMLCGRSSSATE